MLLLGAYLVKASILDELAKAAAGSSDVSYSNKVFFLLPILAFAGATALISAAMPSLWKEPQRARVPFAQQPLAYRAAVIAGAVLMMGSGLALRMWFLGRLAELGYSN